MGKSFIAYVAAFGKWGFLMAAMIIGDAIGIIQSYSTDFLIPTWAWWSILVVILVIAPFIAFHKLRLEQEKLQKKLDAIEDAKPIITVEPTVYYSDKAALEIHNNGAGDTFKATARVVKGNIESNFFNLCWQSHPNDTDCRINHDDTESILVAEIASKSELNDNERTTVFKGGIALYQVGGKRIGVSDSQIIENAEWKKRYPSMFKNAAELVDECEIEVTITSDKELSNPFDKQRYLIKIDHENNGVLCITPLELDRGDYQS